LRSADRGVFDADVTFNTDLATLFLEAFLSRQASLGPATFLGQVVSFVPLDRKNALSLVRSEPASRVAVPLAGRASLRL
jgi:hypothetical protein